MCYGEGVKDVWTLDLESRRWDEQGVECEEEVSRRFGHQTVVLEHYLVCFDWGLHIVVVVLTGERGCGCIYAFVLYRPSMEVATKEGRRT